MKKIFGWALLILGVAMIIWGVGGSYQIFTGKKPAPEIFIFQEKQDSEIQKTKTIVNPQEKITQEMKETIQEQLGRMMPSGFTTKIFNLFSWSIFAGILIFAGGKLSGIGINLIK